MPLNDKNEARRKAILEARSKQVLETFCETYGQITIEVMFLAVARWFGMVIFNCCGDSAGRRDAAKKFADKIEEVITNYEKGKTP